MEKGMKAPCEGIVYLRNYYWGLYGKGVLDRVQVGALENLTKSVERDIAKGFSPERTCHDVSKTRGRWKCSVCGRSVSVALDGEPIRFCAGCGARVMREDGK